MRVRHTSILAAVLLLSTAVRPVLADHEETEHRLKTAGVPEEMRERIHAAIDRGVDWLVRQQQADGGFPRGTYASWYPDAALTVLAALALRHADSEKAGLAVARAIPSFTNARGLVDHEIVREVYLAGIGLMLFAAGAGRPEAVEEAATRLPAALPTDSDWWGYTTGGTDGRGPITGANLSTTQFGALGLWSAGRLGMAASPDVWRRHLLSLFAEQRADGSWPYAPGHSVAVSGYVNGTFMGFANLLLAEEALAAEIAGNPGLAHRVAAARARGRAALDRDGPALLDAVASRRPVRWTSYSLFALEKACVFADAEEVGGRRWYVEGAEYLLGQQRASGGWDHTSFRGRGPAREGNIVDTSFALLFLLRDAESYRPVSPRPIESPGGETTPRPEPPPAAPPPPAGDPAPPYVEVELAREILVRLRALLERPPPLVEELLDTLNLLDLARRRLLVDETSRDSVAAAEEFRTAADEALLAAFVSIRVPPNRDENLRSPVNRRAAELLRNAGVAPAPLLAKALERVYLRARFDVPEELWLEAFRTLLALAPEEGLAWLRRGAVDGRVSADEVARVRAALDAIAMAGPLPGRARFQTARVLAETFRSAERIGEANIAKGVWDFSLFRKELRFPLLLALGRLARDPRTGAEPRDAAGNRLGSVEAFSAWLEAHDDPRAAPWKD